MSILGERTLMMLLSDDDSLTVIAKEGLDLRVVPTQALRPVVEWALAHYRTTSKAPTPAVLNEHFADLLADHEIDPAGDVDETIEWAIDDLKGSYVRNEAGSFARRLSTSITEADNMQRVEVLAAYASELAALTTALMPRTTQVDLRASGEDLLDRYQQSVALQGQIIGMSLGVPQLDTYTGGVRDGELAILGGPPKSNKSFYLDYAGLKNWQRGRVVGLFTLENSIPMTEARIACMALGIDIRQLEGGTLPPEDFEALRAWVNDVLRVSDTPFYIFSPAMVQRTPHAIVQTARAYECDDLIIDQLTFMEDSDPNRNNSRTYELRSILHDLKALVSTGRHQMPCLLAHQINREGIKNAQSANRLRMMDFAESSEVERTADWAFALWASEDMKAWGQMLWQTLACRRGPNLDFDMDWDIVHGAINARNQVDMENI